MAVMGLVVLVCGLLWHAGEVIAQGDAYAQTLTDDLARAFRISLGLGSEEVMKLSGGHAIPGILCLLFGMIYLSIFVSAFTDAVNVEGKASDAERSASRIGEKGEAARQAMKRAREEQQSPSSD